MDVYGTLVDANLFFEQRLHTLDWDRAPVSDRQAALVAARDLIDQFDYEIDITVDTPTEIEQAGYLIASALLSGRDPDMDLESLSLSNAAYGGVASSTGQLKWNMLPI